MTAKEDAVKALDGLRSRREEIENDIFALVLKFELDFPGVEIRTIDVNRLSNITMEDTRANSFIGSIRINPVIA